MSDEPGGAYLEFARRRTRVDPRACITVKCPAANQPVEVTVDLSSDGCASESEEWHLTVKVPSGLKPIPRAYRLQWAADMIASQLGTQIEEALSSGAYGAINEVKCPQ